MTLDPAIRIFLDQVATLGTTPIEDLSPGEVRDVYRLLIAADGEPEPVTAVMDLAIDGPAGEIPIRVYRPAASRAEPLPVLVWYHGGGFVIGDLDTADGGARRLANRCGALTVSVDYRLAPEHPWPVPLDDGWGALTWVAAHAGEIGGDPARLAVGGDSAGGNLATMVALRAARQGGPRLVHQLLVYPWCDLTMSLPSVGENGDGYLLTAAHLRWFVGHFLADRGDPKDPAVSPIFIAVDHLAGVAPATVVAAEFDPLRDENAVYAERLAEAGVPVEHRCYEGMIHGFSGLGAITPAALDAADWAATRLRASLSRQ
ncbi:MAG: alpha/beta hydrolase [Acidimicrobiales bacterium]